MGRGRKKDLTAARNSRWTSPDAGDTLDPPQQSHQPIDTQAGPSVVAAGLDSPVVSAADSNTPQVPVFKTGLGLGLGSGLGSRKALELGSLGSAPGNLPLSRLGPRGSVVPPVQQEEQQQQQPTGGEGSSGGWRNVQPPEVKRALEEERLEKLKKVKDCVSEMVGLNKSVLKPAWFRNGIKSTFPGPLTASAAQIVAPGGHGASTSGNAPATLTSGQFLWFPEPEKLGIAPRVASESLEDQPFIPECVYPLMVLNGNPLVYLIVMPDEYTTHRSYKYVLDINPLSHIAKLNLSRWDESMIIRVTIPTTTGKGWSGTVQYRKRVLLTAYGWKERMSRSGMPFGKYRDDPILHRQLVSGFAVVDAFVDAVEGFSGAPLPLPGVGVALTASDGHINTTLMDSILSLMRKEFDQLCNDYGNWMVNVNDISTRAFYAWLKADRKRYESFERWERLEGKATGGKRQDSVNAVSFRVWLEQRSSRINQNSVNKWRLQLSLALYLLGSVKSCRQMVQRFNLGISESTLLKHINELMASHDSDIQQYLLDQGVLVVTMDNFNRNCSVTVGGPGNEGYIDMNFTTSTLKGGMTDMSHEDEMQAVKIIPVDAANGTNPSHVIILDEEIEEQGQQLKERNELAFGKHLSYRDSAHSTTKQSLNLRDGLIVDPLEPDIYADPVHNPPSPTLATGTTPMQEGIILAEGLEATTAHGTRDAGEAAIEASPIDAEDVIEAVVGGSCSERSSSREVTRGATARPAPLQIRPRRPATKHASDGLAFIKPFDIVPVNPTGPTQVGDLIMHLCSVLSPRKDRYTFYVADVGFYPYAKGLGAANKLPSGLVIVLEPFHMMVLKPLERLVDIYWDLIFKPLQVVISGVPPRRDKEPYKSSRVYDITNTCNLLNLSYEEGIESCLKEALEKNKVAHDGGEITRAQFLHRRKELSSIMDFFEVVLPVVRENRFLYEAMSAAARVGDFDKVGELFEEWWQVWLPRLADLFGKWGLEASYYRCIYMEIAFFKRLKTSNHPLYDIIKRFYPFLSQRGHELLHRSLSEKIGNYNIRAEYDIVRKLWDLVVDGGSVIDLVMDDLGILKSGAFNKRIDSYKRNPEAVPRIVEHFKTNVIGTGETKILIKSEKQSCKQVLVSGNVEMKSSLGRAGRPNVGNAHRRVMTTARIDLTTRAQNNYAPHLTASDKTVMEAQLQKYGVAAVVDAIKQREGRSRRARGEKVHSGKGEKKNVLNTIYQALGVLAKKGKAALTCGMPYSDGSTLSAPPPPVLLHSSAHTNAVAPVPPPATGPTPATTAAAPEIEPDDGPVAMEEDQIEEDDIEMESDNGSSEGLYVDSDSDDELDPPGARAYRTPPFEGYSVQVKKVLERIRKEGIKCTEAGEPLIHGIVAGDIEADVTEMARWLTSTSLDSAQKVAEPRVGERSRPVLRHDMIKLGQPSDEGSNVSLWLNDSTIDAFGMTLPILIKGAPAAHKPAVIASNLCIILAGQTAGSHSSEDQTRSVRYAKDHSLLEHSILFLPLNFGNVHWTLLGADLHAQVVFFLDPMGGSDMGMLDMFVGWLQMVVDKQKTVENDSLRRSWDIRQWRVVRNEDWRAGAGSEVMQQRDTWNCGVAVCWYMYRIAAGLKINEEVDLNKFRDVLAVALALATFITND